MVSSLFPPLSFSQSRTAGGKSHVEEKPWKDVAVRPQASSCRYLVVHAQITELA
ncbi:hypothetical protein BDR04DRAFT_1106124 [Suillus decipiens]|nr:hypothetical protein BDR04DRAFT_1106124 [Suillus decipiens]